MDTTQLERGSTAAMLAAGDAAALQVVVTGICPEIHRSLRKKFYPSLREEDIEDALSVALSRLWFFRSSYDPQRATLRDYFYVIARNAAVDILRSKARHNALLAEMAQAAESQADRAPPRQEEGSRSLSSLRGQSLLRALQDLPARDQHILFEYALAEGHEPWAARVADEFGLPASTVRVRRLRLMEKLRQRLQSDNSQRWGDDTMFRDREAISGGATAMQHSFDEVSRALTQRREELGQVLAAIRCNLESGIEAEKSIPASDESPFGFFKRMWNQSVEDRTIEEPGRSSTLKTLGGWLHDIEAGSVNLRDACQDFVRRHDATFGKSSLSVEEVERSLIGLSQALQRGMPDATAGEGRGRLVVRWDDGRGFARWSDSVSNEPIIDIKEAIRNSAEYHGKVAQRNVREAFVSQIQDDLRDGRLAIPSFVRNSSESDRNATVFEWCLASGKATSIDLPAPGLKFAIAELPPSETEMDLWAKHRELAELMDEAVCVVVQSQYSGAFGDSSAKQGAVQGNVLQPLLGLIQDTTDNRYPRSSAMAMLLPFVDQGLAGTKANDEIREAYERAFLFLASEL